MKHLEVMVTVNVFIMLALKSHSQGLFNYMKMM